MRSAVPILILFAAALSGCESRIAGSLLYMTPYGLDDFDCAELKRRVVGAEGRLKQVEALRDRAGASAAGPVINATVYGPDYSRALWEVRLYQDEMARKSCDAPPPQPASPGVSDAVAPAPAPAAGGSPGSPWPGTQPQGDVWPDNQLPGNQWPGRR